MLKSDTNQVQETLGLRYGNIGKIGAGGMGSVFAAFDGVLARPVAIKLLSRAMASDEMAVRFQQEAKLASRLHHPSIVTVLDFGKGENGVFYLIMDLVEGSSLTQVIKESGSLPLDQALNIFIQICDALAHAHGQGIVHRDIKPSNIMLSEKTGLQLDVHIVDFGLAKVILEDHRITKTGAVVGTPPLLQSRTDSVD